MKKIFRTFFVVLLLFLFILNIYPVKANIAVMPAEVHIKMDDSYITGNTTRKITITNNYPDNITIRSYVTNPDPPEWIRSGRTNIENLSWITLEPRQILVPANGGTADLYIYLFVPEASQQGNLSKHWETWLNIKPEASGISMGYSVRIYIDTPEESASFYQLYLIIIAGVVIIIGLLLMIFIRKKQKEKEKKKSKTKKENTTTKKKKTSKSKN